MFMEIELRFRDEIVIVHVQKASLWHSTKYYGCIYHHIDGACFGLHFEGSADFGILFGSNGNTAAAEAVIGFENGTAKVIRKGIAVKVTIKPFGWCAV